MRPVFPLILSAVLFLSCFSGPDRQKPLHQTFNHDANQGVNRMSLDENSARCWCLILEIGKRRQSSPSSPLQEMNDEVASLVKKYRIRRHHPLFARKCKNSKTNCQLTDDYQKGKSKNPTLMLSIDQEGGIVTGLGRAKFQEYSAGRSREAESMGIRPAASSGKEALCRHQPRIQRPLSWTLTIILTIL